MDSPMKPDKARQPASLSNDELTLAAASRSLQRKLAFWRRAVWSVLGIVLIFAVVLWNRAGTHRRNCSGALEHYAQLAQDAHLEKESEQILKAQWQDLDRHSDAKPRVFPPSHYTLLVENWGQVPKEGESIPLAVCSSPHMLLFSYGRHVLYRDAKGFHVEWGDEEKVRPLIRKASSGQPTP
jgi:hypothetical protein